METITKASIVVLILSTSAIASDKGWINQAGNDLLPRCSLAVDLMDNKDLNGGQANDALECMHYVAGYLDGYGVASAAEKGKPFLCFPDHSNTGQMVRVFVKWMRDHPEKLHLAASACFFEALTDAFMCKYPK